MNIFYSNSAGGSVEKDAYHTAVEPPKDVGNPWTIKKSLLLWI